MDTTHFLYNKAQINCFFFSPQVTKYRKEMGKKEKKTTNLHYCLLEDAYLKKGLVIVLVLKTIHNVLHVCM